MTRKSDMEFLMWVADLRRLCERQYEKADEGSMLEAGARAAMDTAERILHRLLGDRREPWGDTLL